MNKYLPPPPKFGYLGLITGERLSLAEPDPDMMDIETIANALSNLCRFCGQVKEFYSVAQHSVLVSRIVPEHLAWEGLMHDATEAFCADLPKPIKQEVQGYDEIEEIMWRALCRRYGLPAELPPEVHDADMIAVMTEARDNTGSQNWMHWYPELEPLPNTVHPLPPTEAKVLFLNRVLELRPEYLS